MSDIPGEVRVDPLTGLRTILAPDRADRPGGALRAPAPVPVDPEDDPFLEGHEDRTPPELHALAAPGHEDRAPDTPGWAVRVVPNRFPALHAGAPTPEPHARPALFSSAAARGAHEVIVNAPTATATLGELPVAQVAAALEVWRARIAHHRAAGAACAHLIVNERAEAGASLPHTHAQLFALDFVPAAVARERERFGAYATQTMGGNLLGDLVQEEVRRRARLVAYDDEAVCFAPFASRVPFQLCLAPRTPQPRFEEAGTPTGAALLHDVLNRLARHLGAPPPLNLWVRTAPQGAEAFGWRIDVLPRLVARGGLELGTGVDLLTVAPEDAAAALRAEA